MSGPSRVLMQVVVPLSVVLGTGLVIGAWWTYSPRSSEMLARADRGARQDAVTPAHVHSILRAASRRYVPAQLGLELGMSLDDVRLLRPAMHAIEASVRSERAYEDNLGDDRVVMVFDEGHSLVEVQLMKSLRGVAAIAPHLDEARARVGDVTGVWDCPQTGNVPTRRFTFRGELVSAEEVFLVYGQRVSVTTVITTTQRVAASLMRSACRPVEREALDTFPSASPEAVRTP